MGSTSLEFTFVIVFPFLLFIFQNDSISAYGLDYGRVNEDSKLVSQKVNLSVYYEALNPSCASFMVKNLARIFDNGLNTIVNLRLIPWGNAYLNKSTNAIVCQVRFSLWVFVFIFFQVSFLVSFPFLVKISASRQDL